MSNKTLVTQFSYLIAGTFFILSALAVHAKASPLIVSGLVLLSAWGITHYFYILKNQEQGCHLLTGLFLIFSILFTCLTGGFYSPGLLILFFMPVLTCLFSDKKKCIRVIQAADNRKMIC